MSGVRSSRNPSDCSALTHSDNRAYLAAVLRPSAQIPPRGTSDTLRTLAENAANHRMEEICHLTLKSTSRI